MLVLPLGKVIQFFFRVTPCQNLKECILNGDGWKWPEASSRLPEIELSNAIGNSASFFVSVKSNCVIMSDQFAMRTYPCNYVSARIICFKGRNEFYT